MLEPATAECLTTLYRVGRSRGLLSYSEITPADALRPRAGNRFDVPGGGVLYAGSSAVACYAETLARFRPSPVIREVVKDEDASFMVIGGVPRDWRLQRSVADLELGSPLPFLDVEAPETHAYLSEVLASEILALGYTDNLDISDLCNQDRRLSRLIARYAYTAAEQDGSPLFSGIRYASRISTEWECWAIFEGTQVDIAGQRPIELNDPDLRFVADLWDLKLF